MDLMILTLSLSLFDSLSTTVQIVVFVLMLTTANPHRNALSFLAGLGGTYFMCGVFGYLVFDELRPLLSKLLNSGNVQDPVYYLSEFLMGLVLAGLGVVYFYRSRKAKKSRLEDWVQRRLKDMKPWFAFGLGAFISITSLSPLYFAALGKYAALPQGPAVLGLILLYNLGYLSPMILIWLAYLFFLKEIPSLREKADRLNIHLAAWTLVGSGLFFMMDAVFFFAQGQALMKGRIF